MNSEGTVPGSSEGSVPGSCKLMAKERNTLTSKWPAQAGTAPSASTAQAGGSRRDSVPFWAQDHGKPAGSRTGVEVENTAVSPEGQVLGGPVFTRVALKGFRTHTLRKTRKVSHAESRFSPVSGPSLFWFERSTKLAVDTAPHCGHHPSEHKLQDVKQILEALKKKHSLSRKGCILFMVFDVCFKSKSNVKQILQALKSTLF